ncbi:hypothetical protein [Halalkalicoccus ordinarius]|uniref:hypothetical protein n=1 Tax=Halalkalicoccus ordinarius TaxID=3116651 RepID=UPI00300F4937
MVSLSPESGIQLANLIVSSILTVALVYLYKKQSESIANQTVIAEKQTNIMEKQNNLVELQQNPHDEVLYWNIHENEIELSISNIGKGTASELSINLVFIFSDSKDPDDEVLPPFSGNIWTDSKYETKGTDMERLDWETSGVKRSIKPSETDVNMTADPFKISGLGETDWPTESKQEFSKTTNKRSIGYELRLVYETPTRRVQEITLFRAAVPIENQTTLEDLLLIIEGGIWQMPDRGIPSPDNQILP